MISVEYISKKGKEMCHSIFIPIGRRIKQELVKERRRLALKIRMQPLVEKVIVYQLVIFVPVQQL